MGRWLEGVRRMNGKKRRGLIADDGGGFFGWGIERGHLVKSEILCKFSPMNPGAWKVVNAWASGQLARALDEKYFALTLQPQEEIDSKVGPALSNYHLWCYEVLDQLDPNGVMSLKGISSLLPTGI